MDLGLTASQVNVFTIMSRYNISTAKSIWSTAKVGRQDIYRVLLELQKLGLVEKVIAAPSQYRAIPMAEAISILYQRKKEQITQLQTEAVELVENLCQNEEEIYSDQYKCIMIPAKETLLLRLEQTFKHAQRTISISSTMKRLSVALSTETNLYTEALERGVRIKVIVNTEDNNWFRQLEQPYFRKPNFKIRCTNYLPPAAFTIFDERESYISTITEAGFLDARCLWSNYPSIIKLLQSHFEMQWNIAKENVEQTTAQTIDA